MRHIQTFGMFSAYIPFPFTATPWPPPRPETPRGSPPLSFMRLAPVGESELPAQNAWSRFAFCSLCCDNDVQFVPSSPRYSANKYLTCNLTPKATLPAVCPSVNGALVHSAVHAKHLGFSPTPLFLSALHMQSFGEAPKWSPNWPLCIWPPPSPLQVIEVQHFSSGPLQGPPDDLSPT